MASPTPPEDSVPVEINGQSIDPQDVYARDAQNTDYIVITARAILSITEEEELQALGVTFVEDLGELNFLCNYEHTNLSPIREKSFVRQVDVYRNKFKIPAALEAGTEHVHACEVDVLVHDGVGDLESLAAFIAREARVSVDELEMVPGKIRLTIDPCRLEAIVKDDRIRIVEEVLRPSLHDDTARRIINGSAEMMAGSTYRGKGQIVTVTDSGFDKGCLEDCHPAFTGKVLNLVPVVRRDSTKFSEKQKVNDPNGHGTHVCGIILGSDFDTSEGLIGGIAPDAKLIVQSLWNNSIRDISLPMDTSILLTVPYSQGSRIFSNSWGVGWLKTPAQQPDYAEPAKVIDNFVRDNPDALACFSAGNDHVHSGGRPAVGLEAGAKNVLTVGASGTTRLVNEGSDQMWQSSSRGPSREGRLKPDVIAPGVQVYSALSREAKYFGKGAVNERFPDVKWKPLSGTSQATPLVAGCAAVLREVLEEKGCQSPPGALLKALIINGADKLPGIEANAQGFGRVNLMNSIAMISAPPAKSEDAISQTSLAVHGGTLIGSALKQDEEFEFVIPSTSITDSKAGFKITMVYNDIGAKEIQNNLNIIVTDVNKDQVEYGNTKSLTQTDLQNNVEQVVMSYVPTGDVRVKVHAQKIFAGSEQDYVLAWSTFNPL